MKIIPINDCLKKNDFEFIKIDSTTSTMNEAKKKINFLKKNLIILSKKQTEGKGRLGNKWISPLGNIYSSIVTSNLIDPYILSKFGMLTSVAIKKSLEYINIDKVFFKWPNDIYVENKKISGIIQEYHYNLENKKFLIIGVGINVCSSPQNIKYKTTFIKEFNKKISVEYFFEIFINFFLDSFDNFINNKKMDFIFEYKKKQMFLNDIINIKVGNNKIINGKFIKINNDGSLLLKNNNKEISIYSGQIQV